MLRSISGADAIGEPFAVLELVQARAPASRQGEPAIIAGMTREIAKRYGIDEQKVWRRPLSRRCDGRGDGRGVSGCLCVGIHSGLPVGSAHDVQSALSVMRGAPPASTPALPPGAWCRRSSSMEIVTPPCIHVMARRSPRNARIATTKRSLSSCSRGRAPGAIHPQRAQGCDWPDRSRALGSARRRPRLVRRQRRRVVHRP